jgi:hypothetical protein
MILLTGQGDRGNLVAFNGGTDVVMDSHQIIKIRFCRDFAAGRFLAFMINFASWKPDPKP